MENQELTIINSSDALGAITRSEIDLQIATAKTYPRNLAQVTDRVMSLASFDADTAASCFYKKPVGKDKFGVMQYAEGESVRLAEILADCWGNLRIATRIVADDGKSVTVQAVCHDLETNVSVMIEKRKSVFGKNGRYGEEQVAVVCDAASSIAFRNAIFRVIPKAAIRTIITQVKQVAARQVADLTSMQNGLVDWYAKYGVTAAQLCEFIGVPGVKQLTVDQCLTLKGLSVAIKDGETSVEEAILNPIKERKAEQEAEKKRNAAQNKVAEAMEKNKNNQ